MSGGTVYTWEKMSFQIHVFVTPSLIKAGFMTKGRMILQRHTWKHVFMTKCGMILQPPPPP